MPLPRPRSRLGVSPVVSDVVLAFVVVMSMTLLLTLVMYYTQPDAPWKLTAQEMLVVEHVWFNGTAASPEGFGLWVYNYGEVKLIVRRIFISPGPHDPVWEGELEVPPGGSHKIYVEFAWEPGQTYEITIMTRRGNGFVVLAKAPPA